MKEWTSKAIETFRTALKLSRAEFGERLGVTRIHIYYLEKGVKKPSKSLCLFLNCIEREIKREGGLQHRRAKEPKPKMKGGRSGNRGL